MKILLAYCRLMRHVVQELADVEDIEIVPAYTFDQARRIVAKGVDGVIANIQMPLAKDLNPNSYGVHPSVPWGITLALAAQNKDTPIVLISDSWKTHERVKFLDVLFKQIDKPAPKVFSLYGGGNQRDQREVYMTLRKQMKTAVL